MQLAKTMLPEPMVGDLTVAFRGWAFRGSSGALKLLRGLCGFRGCLGVFWSLHRGGLGMGLEECDLVSTYVIQGSHLAPL